MLLACLVKEVEDFAASRRTFDDDAKAEEIWLRFVKNLKDGKPSKPSKPSTPRGPKGSKKTASTKGRRSIQ